MRFIKKNIFGQRGGFGPLFFSLVVAVFLTAVSSSSFSNQKPDIKILYFFSSTCSHCNEARKDIIDLSKEFTIEGLHFGEGKPSGYPFPVKAGDKKIAREVYHIAGVPTLAVIVDNAYRMKIAGPRDIHVAGALIKALSLGARTVSETTAQGPQKNATITGWITSKGDYFKHAEFFITDRQQTLPVRPWLPLEAARSPFNKKRPRLMSDVIGKPVALEGTVKRTDGALQFTVGKELTLE